MATKSSQRTDKDTSSSTSFDAAALAVATAAGAISVFLAPGPYDWLSPVIGVTLIAVVWAYEHSRERTIIQSIALSMSTAFISLLIFGLYREWYLSGLGLDEWILGGEELVGICPVEEEPVYTDDCQKDPESAVTSVWLAKVWVVVAILVFLGDLGLQKRRQQQNVTDEVVDERRASLSD